MSDSEIEQEYLVKVDDEVYGPIPEERCRSPQAYAAARLPMTRRRFGRARGRE